MFVFFLCVCVYEVLGAGFGCHGGGGEVDAVVTSLNMRWYVWACRSVFFVCGCVCQCVCLFCYDCERTASDAECRSSVFVRVFPRNPNFTYISTCIRRSAI